MLVLQENILEKVHILVVLVHQELIPQQVQVNA
jgi:hypothetical protein